MLPQLKQRFQTLDSEVSKLGWQHEQAVDAADVARLKAGEAVGRSAALARECDALRTVGELLRESVKGKVERLVTMALREIYGTDDYEFELEFELQRGQMTATPMLRTTFRGERMTVPVAEAHGGGVVNVVAFALRVVVLCLTRPKLQRVIVADESFRNVSREYLPRVAEWLRQLHEVTGVQVVMVTHQPEMVEAADKVYRVSKDAAGVTVVKEGGGE